MKFSDDDGLRKVFDLSSPMQMLTKLQWENEQIKSMIEINDPKVIFAAFNAAATAWHLIDWVVTFSKIYPDTRQPHIEMARYRKDAISRCPELGACRQLSVGWKHRVVSNRNDPTVQALHVVDFYERVSDGKLFSSQQHRPVIYVGTHPTSLDVIFEAVTLFWSDELARLNFPGKGFIDLGLKAKSK
jgi:hypothetical protein